MKLSSLVAYRNEIAQHSVSRSSARMFKTVQDLINDVRSNSVASEHDKIRFGEGTYAEQAERDKALLDDAVANAQQNLDFYLEQLDLAIEQLGHRYLINSHEDFDTGWKHDDVQVISKRELQYTKELADLFRSRLAIYADWRYPGLCVGPMRTEFTDELISNDPLYVADIDQRLIDPFLDQQNQTYRHRVRPYVIQPWDWNRRLFRDLPEGQFGLVFIANYFEYLPLDGIKSMLAEVHGLLRPGGTCVFTFNDCDNYQNIKLCEHHYKSYTPGGMMVDECQQLGYKVTHKHDHSYGFGWMEITKRGALKTLKGGQALAQIRSTVPGAPIPTETYSKEDIKRIRQEAIDLKIDTKLAIKSGAISTDKLQLLIQKRKRAEQKKLTDAQRPAQAQKWTARNMGYIQGQCVAFNQQMWMAMHDIEPKQRFDRTDWQLVK